MIQTRKANPNKPYRIMVYGPEGVGKSTLGAKADRPVFISPEGGSDQLTDREGNLTEEMPSVDSWDSAMNAISRLLNEEHEFKTVVVDSVDWLEGLAHKKIIGNSGKTIITAAGGFGSGYRQTQNMFQEFVAALSSLREKKEMNVILVAHTHVKDVKDPEAMVDYQAHEIKLHELASSILREWVDALFFVRFKTYVNKDEDKKKGRAFTDDKRVLYTTKRPSFQAKNRYGMPPEMEFHMNVWDDLMPYIRKGTQAPTLQEIHAEATELMSKLKDEETKALVLQSLQSATTDMNKLNQILNRLRTLTKGDA